MAHVWKDKGRKNQYQVMNKWLILIFPVSAYAFAWSRENQYQIWRYTGKKAPIIIFFPEKASSQVRVKNQGLTKVLCFRKQFKLFQPYSPDLIVILNKNCVALILYMQLTGRLRTENMKASDKKLHDTVQFLII